jgi:hypothetical protein
MPGLEDGVAATRMIREMVRNDLFRLIKFITKDEELGLYGKSAAFIAKRMSVKVDDPGFGKLWRSQKKTVKKTLDSKRSTTSMAVKQVVIRKWLPRVDYWKRKEANSSSCVFCSIVRYE